MLTHNWQLVIDQISRSSHATLLNCWSTRAQFWKDLRGQQISNTNSARALGVLLFRESCSGTKEMNFVLTLISRHLSSLLCCDMFNENQSATWLGELSSGLYGEEEPLRPTWLTGVSKKQKGASANPSQSACQLAISPELQEEKEFPHSSEDIEGIEPW